MKLLEERKIIPQGEMVKTKKGIATLRNRKSLEMSYAKYVKLSAILATKKKSDTKGTPFQLDNGDIINTADVMCLELTEERNIDENSENYRDLPTGWVTLDTNGDVCGGQKTHEIYLNAECHYVVKDGQRQFITKPFSKVKEATLVRYDQDYECELVRGHFRYGIRIPLQATVKVEELGDVESYPVV